MKNNSLTEQEFADFFEKDSKGIAPDISVKQRLEYTFMVKSATYKIKQNSFAGMMSWIFSWDNLPVKAALISVVVILSVANFNPIEKQMLVPACDSTQNCFPLHADSAVLLPYYPDTCLTTKLLESESSNTSSAILFNETKKFQCEVLLNKTNSMFYLKSRNSKFKKSNPGFFA